MQVVGGRYGLSSMELTPQAMIKAVFEILAQPSPKNHFTVGIEDDLSHTEPRCGSEFLDPSRTMRARAVLRAWIRRHGGCEQESIKIIGENTDYFAQGDRVDDSKKSGAMTISHSCALVRAQFARRTSSQRQTSLPATRRFSRNM